MLQNMQKKVEEEGEAEKKLYEKFKMDFELFGYSTNYY